MNKKISKFIIMICGSILFGMFFCVSWSKAADLSLEVTEGCYLQYAGDNCIAKLKLQNNTENKLQGEIILDIKYNDAVFDGVGIKTNFKISYEAEWIEPVWGGEAMAGSGFDIEKGINNAELKIETHSALLAGQYSFLVSIKGDSGEEEYTSNLAVISGGGYVNPELVDSKRGMPEITQIIENSEKNKEKEILTSKIEQQVEINYFIEEINQIVESTEEREKLVDFIENNDEAQKALIEGKIKVKDLVENSENVESLFDVLEYPKKDKNISQNRAFLADAFGKIWNAIINSLVLSSAFIFLIFLLFLLGMKKYKKRKIK